MAEETNTPLLKDNAAVTERAIANLNNLKYFTTIDGKMVTTTTEYQEYKHDIILSSLKALGLNPPKTDASVSDKIEDFSINRIPAHKVNRTSELDITELRLSKTGAEKLARAGVKSEVLQTFIPLEERGKTTNHADRVR